MPSEEPEKGDKVSWNWGAGNPGGTVAEKKEKGEIAITSKRGNKIKKNAEPNDPAIHVERSGNDVVKKASELTVEKKASGNGSSNEKKDDENKSEKRKAGDDEQEPLVKNAEGKEVKPGGKAANKKQKQEKEKDKEKEKEDEKDDDKETAEKSKAAKEEEKEVATEKKRPGRPKGGGESKKNKKDPTPRQEGDLVSSRTRSRGK